MEATSINADVPPTKQAAPAGEVLVDQRENGLVRITVNRPHKHNALARQVLAQLRDAVAAAGRDPGTRAVLLTGAGERFFAAGGDLVDLSSVRDQPATLAMIDEAGAALDAIRNCPVPVIAYLNGDAIGGGAELAVACDMRLQSAHARIGFIQAKLAITSAWGGGPDLFELVGRSRAMRMMTRCELIDAATALDLGLADAVIEDGAEGNGVAAFLKPLLQCPPQVLRGIKAQAVAHRKGSGWQAHRVVEKDHLVRTWLHDDHWKAAEQLLSKGSR